MNDTEVTALKERVKLLEAALYRAITVNPKCLNLQQGLPHCRVMHPDNIGCWICHLKKALGKEDREAVLEIIRHATDNRYPLRWYNSYGDFSGREVTIDVFNIEPKDQRQFLRDLRAYRDGFIDIIGSRCLFIFHTPQATKEHYTV